MPEEKPRRVTTLLYEGDWDHDAYELCIVRGYQMLIPRPETIRRQIAEHEAAREAEQLEHGGNMTIDGFF